MRERIIRCKQQSDLWVAARRGRITGAGLGDMMAPPTTRASERKGVKYPAGTEAQCKGEYRKKLIVERKTGRVVGNYVTRAMEEGTEREPFSRMIYEADMQVVVTLVGFALHPLWDWFGCSADGLVGDEGGAEFKNPTEMIHQSYIDDPTAMVAEYQWQVIGNLICFPNRQWWDLVSFNPYFADAEKLIKFRFHRSDFADTIRAIETEAQKFNAEIEYALMEQGYPPTVFDILPQQESPNPVDDCYLTEDELNAPCFQARP